MEFVDGETLAKAFACRPIPVPNALSIGHEILEALAEAHSDPLQIHPCGHPRCMRVRISGRWRRYSLSAMQRQLHRPAIVLYPTENNMAERGGFDSLTPQYAAQLTDYRLPRAPKAPWPPCTIARYCTLANCEAPARRDAMRELPEYSVRLMGRG